MRTQSLNLQAWPQIPTRHEWCMALRSRHCLCFHSPGQHDATPHDTRVYRWSARGVPGSSGCLNCGGDMCLKEAQTRYARDVSFTGLKCQLCPWRDKARRGPRCTDRQVQPSHWPCLPVSHAPCGNMKPLSFPSSARFGSQPQLAANERTVGTRNKKRPNASSV